jgi:8-oxo-dGTP diphosphatase
VPEGPGVAAIVACIDSAGRILVVKQTTGPFAGAWLLPGGAAKPGELVEEAARRELAEETGYHVEDLELVARYLVRSVPPGRFEIVLHMFRGGALQGDLRAEAGSEARWVGPRELELHPSMAVQLADLGLIEPEPASVVEGLARIGAQMRQLP